MPLPGRDMPIDVVWILACTALSATLVVMVREYARRQHLLDRPNERSSHTTPTPRLGGLGVVVAFLAIAIWRVPLVDGTGPILAGVAAISLLGLVDDVHPLPARVRFGVQASVAIAVVWARFDAIRIGTLLSIPVPSWLLAPLLVVWIVWMTNLYNFMDGIDGLAAGQAVLACAGLGAAAMTAGAAAQGALLLLLAGASIGFLLFNFPPASIFMGDVGSTAIGFFLATVPLQPAVPRLSPEAVWIAVGLFVLDATTTLLRRVARGERWSQAHRSHWYQRPLRCGVPHRTITFAAYAGMLPLAAAAVVHAVVPTEVRLALLLLPVAAFAVLARGVVRLERAHSRASSWSAPPQGDAAQPALTGTGARSREP